MRRSDMRKCCALFGLLALTGSGLGQESNSYASNGVVFKYPTGWVCEPSKVATDKPGTVATLTVQNKQDSFVMLLIYSGSTDPKLFQTTMEKKFRETFEG